MPPRLTEEEWIILELLASGAEDTDILSHPKLQLTKDKLKRKKTVLFRKLNVDKAIRAAGRYAAFGKRIEELTHRDTEWDQLTPELQYFACQVSKGLTNDQLVMKFYISESRVNDWVKKLYRVLNISTRNQLPLLIAGLETPHEAKCKCTVRTSRNL